MDGQLVQRGGISTREKSCRRADRGPRWRLSARESGSHSDLTVAENTTYFYRSVAFNTAGSSGFSNTGSATTPQTIPIAPGNLVASAASASQINLSWSDNSFNESLFRIERSSTSIGPWTEIATVGAGGTTFANTGLAETTTYYYRVRASNTAGPSGYTNVSSATTPATIPIAPTGLGATAVSSSQINLAWTDNSFNETGFRIERSSTSIGPWTLIATTGPGATSYSNTGLNPSTLYFYRVLASNTAGSSVASNTASATTFAATPTPTSTPTRTPTRLDSDPDFDADVDPALDAHGDADPDSDRHPDRDGDTARDRDPDPDAHGRRPSRRHRAISPRRPSRRARSTWRGRTTRPTSRASRSSARRR